MPVLWAKEFGIELISEIELASLLCPGKIIAVTGTNGKTTVTTLIAAMIRAWGKKVFVCGNIGNPFSAEIPKIGKDDFVSLEVSSFQLETIKTFRPYISLILNLSRNHLDRYNDMRDYLQAKKRIFLNQGSGDYLVLNKHDPVVSALAAEAKAKVVYFGPAEGLNPNQAAVLSVASILGIDKESVLKVFAEFKGVEHRLEEVSRLNGVKFINDSKATTVDATIWALKNIAHPVILIAGGREKGNDYSVIKDLVREKVKELILIGEAREKIGKFFKGVLSAQEASSLKEAVEAAFSKAKPGDSILFSPMCKSFDMFSDYEHRGKVFKEAVLSLVNNRD
jgi:UDP-N-acetylmuramoylalanine--D-glutamate ligase